MHLKAFGIFALLLVGCVRAPIIEAPTVIRVEGVEAESLTDEPPYVPTPKWYVYARMPGNEPQSLSQNKDIDGATFEWGAIKATTSLEGRNIRLDCSTGAAGTIMCLSDEAVMTATCERMIFEFKCSLR